MVQGVWSIAASSLVSGYTLTTSLPADVSHHMALVSIVSQCSKIVYCTWTNREDTMATHMVRYLPVDR
jgi:hypothetical protein